MPGCIPYHRSGDAVKDDHRAQKEPLADKLAVTVRRGGRAVELMLPMRE